MFSTRSAKVARRAFIAFVVVSVPASVWFAYRVDRVLTNIEESIVGPYELPPDDSLTKAISDQRQISESTNRKLDEAAGKIDEQWMVMDRLAATTESHLKLTSDIASLQKERGKRISANEKGVTAAKKQGAELMERVLKIERRLNTLETDFMLMNKQETKQKQFFNGRKHSK